MPSHAGEDFDYAAKIVSKPHNGSVLPSIVIDGVFFRWNDPQIEDVKSKLDGQSLWVVKGSDKD
jgi:hypothetical protein